MQIYDFIVYDLPNRDGNLFISAFMALVAVVYDLPNRDGNHYLYVDMNMLDPRL